MDEHIQYEWKPLALVVDDDADMAQLNARLLRRLGCDTLVAMNAVSARKISAEHRPDMYVLDIGLPDGDGLSLCAEIRKTADAPILFITGRTETRDRIAGLETGGDYYLTKPYDRDEFTAVVQNLLRRVRQTREMMAGVSIINKGSLTLMLDSRKALVNGNDAALSPREFAVLLTLVQNEDREISNEKLYESVWNAPMFNNSGAVRVHISNLKKKLDEENATDFSIYSGRGRGYTFSAR